ncbi:MAG: hypothetical protein ACE5QF_05970, partial [Thermoplasmata archaeon]
MRPDNLRRRCLLLASVLVLQSMILIGFSPVAGSDPAVIDNLDGTKTVVWDLEDPANYTHSGVTLAGGYAELERVNESFVDTLEADFLLAEATENISVLPTGEIRLSGNAGDLISGGDFSSDGSWDNTSSSGGNITAERDPMGENALMRHQSGMTDVQFDSMDDIVGSGW